jgi:hypothetical protein
MQKDGWVMIYHFQLYGFNTDHFFGTFFGFERGGGGGGLKKKKKFFFNGWGFF